MLVCTVLPTYNERENIGPLIEGILASAVTPHLVLVVDDNSPDGTWQVVEAIAARAQLRRGAARGPAPPHRRKGSHLRDPVWHRSGRSTPLAPMS